MALACFIVSQRLRIDSDTLVWYCIVHAVTMDVYVVHAHISYLGYKVSFNSHLLNLTSVYVSLCFECGSSFFFPLWIILLMGKYLVF